MRLSNVLVAFGLTLENIFLPFLYIIVPFLPIIIPMAFLFGTLVSFSRLSADGEITALLASGASLRKCFLPVLAFSGVMYVVSTLCSVHLEAWGRREFVQFIYKKTQTEVDNMIRFKIQSGVFLNNFIGYVLYTEHISSDRSKLSKVILSPQNDREGSYFTMAPNAEIIGSVAEGDLRMILHDGVSYSFNRLGERSSTMRFERAEVDILRVFQERILGDDSEKDDYRSYNPIELKNYIDKVESSPAAKPKNYLKAKYLYYSRFFNSLLIIIFAFFGVILGVQDQRHGKSRGYIYGILTIIFCFVVLVGFRWVAEQGIVPVQIAVWAPQIVLFLFALFSFYQKNRLPPSEPIYSFRNLPFVGK